MVWPHMIDVDSFTEDQKKLLSLIVDDFRGPTATPTLLFVMERVLYSLKPDWELDTFSNEPDVRQDIEVCLAALSYYKIEQIAKEG
jgi:hypothetical protein